MQLIFQGGNEVVKMVIDRVNKTLQLSSAATNYQMQSLPFKKLFDSGKETIQEALTDKMDDEAFKHQIVSQMAKVGYTLKSQ